MPRLLSLLKQPKLNTQTHRKLSSILSEYIRQRWRKQLICGRSVVFVGQSPTLSLPITLPAAAAVFVPDVFPIFRPTLSHSVVVTWIDIS
jgi:hypothetical protein